MGNKPLILLLAVAACLAGAALLYQLGSILVPLAIALVLAYLIDPLVDRLVSWRINRTLAILAVFFGVLLVAGLLCWFYAVSLTREFQAVQLNLPDYANRLYEMIPLQVKTFFGIETQVKAYAQMTRVLDGVRGASLAVARESFSFLRKAFSSTLSLILTVLGYCIIPLYLYYFLLDLPKLRDSIREMVPARYRQGVDRRGNEIREILAAFVRGQLLVCLILALLYSAGLYAIGIDLALVIGSLAGITFIIPYVGTILGIILSTLMALLKFHDLLHPFLCLGWFLVVQALEGSIITPRVVGNKVGLHPIITIIALLIGGQLFGILGMIGAVPVTAVLKVFARSLRESYLRSRFYQEGA